jgi:hypothetical protein
MTDVVLFVEKRFAIAGAQLHWQAGVLSLRKLRRQPISVVDAGEDPVDTSTQAYNDEPIYLAAQQAITIMSAAA